MDVGSIFINATRRILFRDFSRHPSLWFAGDGKISPRGVRVGHRYFSTNQLSLQDGMLNEKKVQSLDYKVQLLLADL